MTDLVIETRSLRKAFGRKVAVEDLSLAVGRGEVFGFLGPNGAGKTTSIKLLLGLIEPTAGDGTLLGAPLGAPQSRARAGFLPEHFRFHDCLTGRELLRIHGKLFGLRRARLETRIDSLLARVDLADAADRQLKTYSKGMMQRAGLAQALINEPDVVFLDEPTSGLDPLGRVLVRSVIEELRKRGTTVFLNSHLLGEVELTCDRVVFFKLGRVVGELTLGAATPTLSIELKIDRADSAVLEGLAAFGSKPEARDGVVHLQVPDERTVPEIARWLVGQGLAVYEIRSRRKSLEEWFIEAMGDDQRPG
jgi:ABC-2 type transport system ATP-binding protein